MAEGTKSGTGEPSSAAAVEQGTSDADASTGTSSTTDAPSAESDHPDPDTTSVEGRPIATTTSGREAGSSRSDESDADNTSATQASEDAGARRKRSLKRPSKDSDGDKGSRRGKLAKGGQVVKKGSDLIRSRIASVVWLIAVLAAIVLAVGALLYALDANMKNDIVNGVIHLANTIDGPFWRIFEFYQDKKGPGGKELHDATKEHLVNWGLAAVAYLVAGRILDRVIRP